MIDRVVAWARANLWTGARQVVILISWSIVYMTILLAAMAGLVKFASGWDPVVVSSGSMSPTLHVGDVLFVEEHPDELLGQQSVITYRRSADDELVTHRVFEALKDEESYVTKGDANPTPDTDLVHRTDVEGVGRLVVPFLGLPLIWMAEGNALALGALGLLAAAAACAVVFGVRRGRQSQPATDDRFSSTAQRGISRVRLVVALLVGMQFFVDGRQFELAAAGLTRSQTLGAALGCLLAISGLSAYRARYAQGRSISRLAALELVGDTVVVVFLVAASGASGIGWILMALPIIEAAIHFRLTGAFVHWMLMCALSVAIFFWTATSSDTPSATVISDLEQLVDRLGVLLLVVIPGSYLAEQLLGDVLTQRRETERARARSQIMEQVTEAGHEVTRLGGALFENLVGSALDLGFDTADAWVGSPEGGWQHLAQAGVDTIRLPAPGDPGSALRPQDLFVNDVAIDAQDPDPDEYAALAVTGAGVLMRITLASQGEMYAVLRVAATELSDDPTSQIMALRLLSGQASVALQNEQLLSTLRKTYAELENLAMFDTLTGLANRTHFVGLLSDVLTDDEARERTSVMFLDLNGFKAVNDRLGHNSGDELLKGVAERLVEATGDAGTVARLGGDEFTVLVHDRDGPIAAAEIADAIHLALSEPFEIGEDQARVGASIGIAHVEGRAGVSEMLRRADVAMYAAKTTIGAWRTATYRAEFDEEERRREMLAAEFKASLDRDELRLAYQPVVDARDGRIVGVEALLRWRHPDIGDVNAALIVEIAEVTDSVDELNAWVFRTALSEVAECSAGTDVFVAVNVSPRELGLDTLVDNMRDAMARSGLPPSRVVVELSERIVAEAHGSIENVNRLTELGLGLALDDFGEGQTSLAHLRGLPITYLKLDRLFVRHADESSEDRKILGSVVSLAHELGFSVIAEGIETPDHRAIVSGAGADLLQGYGLYEPMPIDEFARLLGTPAAGVGPDELPAPVVADPVAGPVAGAAAPAGGGV